MEYTKNVIDSLDYPVYIFWDTCIPNNIYPFSEKYHNRVQEGSTLGEKIERAFQDLLPYHSPICIIGSDTPHITLDILQSAFQSLLTDSGCCIGPATDGGYYLLGIHSNPELFFRSIKWSTDTVFSDTFKIAIANQLTTKILPTLSDIDTPEDVTMWLKTSKKELCIL